MKPFLFIQHLCFFCFPYQAFGVSSAITMCFLLPLWYTNSHTKVVPGNAFLQIVVYFFFRVQHPSSNLEKHFLIFSLPDEHLNVANAFLLSTSNHQKSLIIFSSLLSHLSWNMLSIVHHLATNNFFNLQLFGHVHYCSAPKPNTWAYFGREFDFSWLAF